MSSPAIVVPFILQLLFFRCGVVAQIPTAYEILQEYDFPVGLLPANIVTSYNLNRVTGEFHVNLSDTCTFSNDGYDVKYKSTISGVIGKDKVTKLKGVSVKVLAFWLDIVEAVRDEGEIDFSVGLLSVGFDVDVFQESPICGCGFHCVASESRWKSLILDW